GTGKTHVAIALGIRACLAGQRVAFATASEWVARLGDAQRQGRLDEELRKLLWTPLLVVDEVGYIPFDPAAANLMFSLVSSRYERASMIVTSNKPFSGCRRHRDRADADASRAGNADGGDREPELGCGPREHRRGGQPRSAGG